MNQIVKLAIFGTTFSSIGIVGAYAGGLFNNEQKIIINTKSRLSDNGFIVLDPNDNDEEWSTVLSEYIKATKETFKEGGIADKNRTKGSLIEECKKQLSLNTDQSYSLARKWCVKEEAVATIIGRKRTLLTTSQEKGEERAIWAQKVGYLKGTIGDKFKELREKLNNQDTNTTTLRTECEKLKPNDIKTTSERFADIFEKTKEFCSNKKN